MKLTKSRLKHIIKEEIGTLFEVAVKDHEKDVSIDIAKKESKDGVFVDLASLVKLFVGEKDTAEINGIDLSVPAQPQPMSLVVSTTLEPAKEQLPLGQGEDADKVFVPSILFGKPISISHSQYGKHNFIVQG